MTLAIAYRLMRVASEHHLRIVDSDPFADVLPNTSPRLAALDQLDRVIYVGTFAKTLSASLRSGYIAANPDTVGALADLKMITRANSSGYVEQIIYDLITSGRYRGHLKRLTGRIEAATQQAYDSLSQLGLPVFGEPRGGFYMWCELPHHIDDKYLSRVAAERSILLAPGSAFNSDTTPNRPRNAHQHRTCRRPAIPSIHDGASHVAMTARRIAERHGIARPPLAHRPFGAAASACLGHDGAISAVRNSCDATNHPIFA